MKKSLILFLGLLVMPLIGASGPTSEQAAQARFKALSLTDRDPAKAAKEFLFGRFVDPVEQAGMTAEIRHEIAQLKGDRGNNSSFMREEMDREDAADFEEETQKVIDHIQWQNTLLTPSGIPIGIYKGDFIKTGLLISEIIADVQLYKELTRRRKDHINAHLLSHTDDMIGLLRRVRDSEGRYEERLGHMSDLTKLLTDHARARDILLNPLRRALEQEHRLVTGYIPISSKTIVPLIARFGWEKFTSWLEGQLVGKPQWDDVSNVRTLFNPRQVEKLKSFAYAYKPNDAGFLRPLAISETPIGITTALYGLLALINPPRSFFKINENLPAFANVNFGGIPVLSRYRLFNKIGGFGIPDVFFSGTAQLIMEVFTIIIAAEEFERDSSVRWTNYVIERRDKLLRKLVNYRAALDSASEGEESIEKAKRSIRKFIEKGHETKSFMPGQTLSNWWSVRDNGKTRMGNYLFAGAASLVALKIAHWWYTLGQK